MHIRMVFRAAKGPDIMRIFIYANCQARGLRTFIPLCADPRQKVDFFTLENFSAIQGQVELDNFEEHLKAADVFIYQPVGQAHGRFSTMGEESVLHRLRSDCACISFPYVYNYGLWPCFLEGDDVINGSSIDCHLDGGASFEDVNLLYDRGELDFHLLTRFQESLKILSEREASLDVKLAPLLVEIFRDYRLFLTQNHPTDRIFADIAYQICRLIFDRPIKCNLVEHGAADGNLSGLPGQYPLDQYAIKELGIKYQQRPDEGASIYYKDMLSRYAKFWWNQRKHCPNV